MSNLPKQNPRQRAVTVDVIPHLPPASPAPRPKEAPKLLSDDFSLPPSSFDDRMASSLMKNHLPSMKTTPHPPMASSAPTYPSYFGHSHHQKLDLRTPLDDAPEEFDVDEMDEEETGDDIQFRIDDMETGRDAGRSKNGANGSHMGAGIPYSTPYLSDDVSVSSGIIRDSFAGIAMGSSLQNFEKNNQKYDKNLLTGSSPLLSHCLDQVRRKI